MHFKSLGLISTTISLNMVSINTPALSFSLVTLSLSLFLFAAPTALPPQAPTLAPPSALVGWYQISSTTTGCGTTAQVLSSLRTNTCLLDYTGVQWLQYTCTTGKCTILSLITITISSQYLYQVP